MAAKILSIVGARPQFIKLAAMHRALASCPALQHQIVHTGQHYDPNLSDQFFGEFALPQPDFALQVGSESHNQQIGQMVQKLDTVLATAKPDLVLIYGDTNSTAAGAVAAKKRHLRLAHIEAGLREFNRSVPEEINKIIADSLADIHFAPTATAVDNLAREGHTDSVVHCGDLSLDLLFAAQPMPACTAAATHLMATGPYVLLTCHRAANTDDRSRLAAILAAVRESPYRVIWPMHPRMRLALQRWSMAADSTGEHITVVDPLPFWDTQHLIRLAHGTLTDSGGIIKESYFHQVPAIVIDDQTEWVEVVQEGWAHIAGADTTRILSCLSGLERPLQHGQSLGDGRAGIRIVEKIESLLT